MIHPVIIGPKTRLAQELIAQLSQRSKEFAQPTIVARNESERVALQSQYPQTAVVDCCQVLTICASERLALFVCALGQVKARIEGESRQVISALEHEITCIQHLLSRQRPDALSLIFVSSVLAWSSEVNHFPYSGAKRLGESALRDVASEHFASKFSAIYPGRLVAERRWSKPTTLLATRYGEAAELMLNLVLKKPQTCIIGWDSRLFLMRGWLASCLPWTHWSRPQA